jgi:dTDP-4-dehydrorhamnose reductase
MRVLLTGSAGQLGSAMLAELREAGHAVTAPPRAELDLADGGSVRATIERARAEAIINCAAFTNVDGAEDDPVGALETNAMAVRTLALAAADRGALLVHFSTDFVFDGEKTEPYVESDPPNPQSTYSMSKLLGEWFAESAPRHYVLRVESLFGGPAVDASNRRSSLDRIVDAIAEGRDARVFIDRTVSPSYAVDVAAAVGQLLERTDYGLYHCVNSGFGTWFDLAEECQRLVGGAGALVPVSVRDVTLRASRPVHAALSNRKLAALGIEMPSWQDALARCVQRRFPSLVLR